MAQKHKYQKESSSAPIVIVLLLVMAVMLILSLGLRILLGTSAPVPKEPGTAVETVSADSKEKPSLWSRLFGAKQDTPQPERVVSRATIAATGDILMHMPVINTGLQEDGSYNFDSVFQYLAPYASAADYAAANLETTLCGTDAGYKYSGYPAFNCPDEILDALKTAGFDLLLTANNHCYDTGEYGFLRTVRTIRSRGMQNLGTADSENTPKYIVQEINGIKIGMVNYTYQGVPENPVAGKVYMNQNTLSDTCGGLINAYLYTDLNPFYAELREIWTKMKLEGAQATVIFIHWGTEYQTGPDLNQQNIAQQICDIGFDAIIGGHPHVLQPVHLLISRQNPEHRTVCAYSTGNAVSNQRISEMDLKTGHTEDAMLFSLTFAKYSDETVYLESTELLPCWVDLRYQDTAQYCIIPLKSDLMDQWQTLYALTDDALIAATNSYNRTLELTGAGMEQIQAYLAETAARRDADYRAAVTQQKNAA